MTSAVPLGATGLIGKLVLPELLNSLHFNRVGEFGRRVTTLPPTEKLLQRTIDFEKLSESGLKDETWDVVYVTLGTTKAIAGSKEAFTKIDYEYVVNAAREARVPGRQQRLVYLSSAGSNPKSYVFYLKSKGETEAALAAIGYDDFIALRPGPFLNADRTGTSRESERFEKMFNWAFSYFPSADVKDISLAVRLAGELGTKGLPAGVADLSPDADIPVGRHTVISNAGVNLLAKSAKK